MCTLQSPYDASILARSMKTLHVRMQRHCENAQKCAEFLESHPKVKKVHYPGLKSHPSFEFLQTSGSLCQRLHQVSRLTARLFELSGAAANALAHLFGVFTGLVKCGNHLPVNNSTLLTAALATIARCSRRP